MLRGKKSARVAASPSAKVPRHVSSWTPAACGDTIGSVEWVELYDDVKSKTYYWNRRTNSTVWKAPAGVWVGAQDERGLRYFWHRVTHASMSELPPLPSG